MSRTDDFAAFTARKQQEREERDRVYVSFRRAILPSLPPGENSGYVAYNGTTGRRAYCRFVYYAERRRGEWEVGLLDGATLVPKTTRSLLLEAEIAAKAIVRDA